MATFNEKFPRSVTLLEQRNRYFSRRGRSSDEEPFQGLHIAVVEFERIGIKVEYADAALDLIKHVTLCRFEFFFVFGGAVGLHRKVGQNSSVFNDVARG